jgi:hypothetical protein
MANITFKTENNKIWIVDKKTDKKALFNSNDLKHIRLFAYILKEKVNFCKSDRELDALLDKNPINLILITYGLKYLRDMLESTNENTKDTVH